MAKSKAPTPQEIYRQRKQKEERERAAYLPPGLINHGNTCFMNSVLQGLIATRLLSDLVLFNTIPSEIQRTAVTPILSRRSPQLTNGRSIAGPYEHPWVNSMPIGDRFVRTVCDAWDAQATRKRVALSPRPVLTTLGQKYDQYLDFAQQDAHEFLRILLDAMRMEEFDVIKKRQPPQPPAAHHKKRRRATITPSNAQHSHDSSTSDPSPHIQIASSSSNPHTTTSINPKQPNGLPHAHTHNGEDGEEGQSIPEPPLMSFSDMIFGGQLTSILVCQKCKHVSQTYEDFNDISLSIKPEDYLPHRKRDRLKKIVGKWTFPGIQSGGSNHVKEGSGSSEKDKSTSTPIPTSAPVPTQAHVPLVPNNTLEVLRSSSVPPSPSTERPTNMPGGGHEELPTEPPRRRSLDISIVSVSTSALVGEVEQEPTAAQNAGEVQEQKAVAAEVPATVTEKNEEENVESSDSSHVIVNVTGPDDKHVEFVEPKIERRDSANNKEVKEEGRDVKEKEKTLKHEEAGWAKLGRRISLNIGLGRPKDKDKDKEKDKKERERKSRSMDRSFLSVGIKEDAVDETPAMQKSHSAGAGSSTPESFPKSRVSSESAVRPIAAPMVAEPSTSSTSTSVQKSSSKPPPTSLSHPEAPSSSSLHASSAVPSLSPAVQRSKSPKPPKPTAAETEYLRKILADVSSSSSSNNPFAIFKPPLLHHHSSYHPGSKTSLPALSGGFDVPSHMDRDKDRATGAAAWLGIGVRSFSGIEECLRLFAAVEVLDGENMVGCRRCWKIQNGMMHSSKRREGGDGEGDDSDQEDKEEDMPAEGEEPLTAPTITLVSNELKTQGQVPQLELKHPQPRPSLRVLAPSMSTSSTSTSTTGTSVHIPTSMSTPTVSFYSHASSTDTQSLSSLPTSLSATDLSLRRDSPDSTLSVSEGSTKTSRSGSESLQHGPGGLPIPVISTTAPVDSPTESSNSSIEPRYASFSDGSWPSGSKSDINRDAAYARLTGTSAPTTNENATRSTPSSSVSSVPSPHPKLTQGIYKYNASSDSKDSLVIPQVGKSRFQKRKSYSDTTTDNDSSEDESDTSVGTSVSADSVASGSAASASQPMLNGAGKNISNINDNPLISTTTAVEPSLLAGSSRNAQPQPQAMSQSQETAKPRPVPQKKPSKPKPVIMRPAYKRYLIATPPPVLVIHLKRFQQTSKTLMSFSHGFKKLDDYVSFPEYLDLLPFLAPRKEDYGLGKKAKDKAKRRGASGEERCMYRLYAVVVHIGNMLGGHYIAYTALPTEPPVHVSRSNGAKPLPSSEGNVGSESAEKAAEAVSAEQAQPTERQWAYMSDTVVRLTTLEEVLNAKAYICMYERC